MPRNMRNPLLVPLLAWLGRLGFPRLFAITCTLFLVNLVVLDPLPFVDELLLGLATLLLASWKRRGATPAPIDAKARRDR